MHRLTKPFSVTVKNVFGRNNHLIFLDNGGASLIELAILSKHQICNLTLGMNSSNRVILISFVSCLLVIIAGVIVWSRIGNRNHSAVEPSQGRQSQGPKGVITNASKKIDQIKTKWADVAGDATKPLSQETIQDLFLTKDFFELIDFLSHSNKFGKIRLEEEVSKMLEQSGNHEFREQLFEYQPTTRSERTLIERWSYFAGSGASKEEFDRYLGRKLSAPVSQNLIFGRAKNLAKSDPTQATQMVVKELSAGIRSSMKNVSLSRVLDNLPENAEFSEIEGILPPDSSNKIASTPEGAGRIRLFARWAQVAPLEAGNYILSHPDRIAPQHIEAVASSFATADLAGAVEWAQDVQQGPHSDFAISTVAIRAAQSYEKEAIQLANMINDLEIREFSLNLIRQEIAIKKGATN